MAELKHDVLQNLKTRSKLGVTRPQVGFANSQVTMLGSDGWKDLGASNPGSNNFDFPKEIYETKTGTPVTTKYRDVVEWSGSMSSELFDYTSLATEAIVGTTLTTEYSPITGTMAYSGTIDATGSTTKVIKINSAAAILASLFEGDTVAVRMGTVDVAGGTWQESQRVIERNPTTNTIIVEGTFSDPPPAGAPIFKVDMEKSYIGGNEMVNRRFRSITSLQNGDIFLLFSEQGNFVEGFSPNYQDGKSAATLPINFAAIGVSREIDGQSRPQVIVAEHVIIRNRKTY